MTRLVLVVVLPLLIGLSSPPAHAERDPLGRWPLVPRPTVVTPFDPPTTPYGAGHRGVDLAGRAGQRVRAALPGRVRFAGRLAGRGVVVIDHGATRTTYEPVTAAVAVGEAVAAGDTVGSLELALSHCFPHACLHWGWLRGEDYRDPLNLVAVASVRLLPLWREGPEPPPGPVGRPARSRAGMGLVVGATQPVSRDMGVTLRGGQ